MLNNSIENYILNSLTLNNNVLNMLKYFGAQFTRNENEIEYLTI